MERSKFVQEKSVICHKFNKPRHKAMFCKRKNVKPFISPKKKIDLVENNIDQVEMKKEMNNIWKKEENELKSESVPALGVDVSSKNLKSFGLGGFQQKIFKPPPKMQFRCLQHIGIYVDSTWLIDWWYLWYEIYCCKIL